MLVVVALNIAGFSLSRIVRSWLVAKQPGAWLTCLAGSLRPKTLNRKKSPPPRATKCLWVLSYRLPFLKQKKKKGGTPFEIRYSFYYFKFCSLVAQEFSPPTVSPPQKNWKNLPIPHPPPHPSQALSGTSNKRENKPSPLFAKFAFGPFFMHGQTQKGAFLHNSITTSQDFFAFKDLWRAFAAPSPPNQSINQSGSTAWFSFFFSPQSKGGISIDYVPKSPWKRHRKVFFFLQIVDYHIRSNKPSGYCT